MSVAFLSINWRQVERRLSQHWNLSLWLCPWSVSRGSCVTTSCPPSSLSFTGHVESEEARCGGTGDGVNKIISSIGQKLKVSKYISSWVILFSLRNDSYFLNRQGQSPNLWDNAGWSLVEPGVHWEYWVLRGDNSPPGWPDHNRGTCGLLSEPR